MFSYFLSFVVLFCHTHNFILIKINVVQTINYICERMEIIWVKAARLSSTQNIVYTYFRPDTSNAVQ